MTIVTSSCIMLRHSASGDGRIRDSRRTPSGRDTGVATPEVSVPPSGGEATASRTSAITPRSVLTVMTTRRGASAGSLPAGD